MKLSESKKGSVESVITDVFALLAYFVFFIIAVYLVSSSGNQSNAQVDSEAVKVDFSMELLNGLRTPVTTTENGIEKNMTFADYLADYADNILCETINYAQCDQTCIQRNAEAAVQQLEPFFNHLLAEGNACVTVNFSSDCNYPNQILPNIVEQKNKCNREIKEQRGEIVFPTKKKGVVTVKIWSDRTIAD